MCLLLYAQLVDDCPYTFVESGNSGGLQTPGGAVDGAAECSDTVVHNYLDLSSDSLGNGVCQQSLLDAFSYRRIVGRSGRANRDLIID